MRLFLWLLPLLCGGVVATNSYPGLAVRGPRSVPALVPREGRDEERLESYARQGLCYGYLNGGNFEKSMAPCKTWCKKEFDTNDHGCNLFIPEGVTPSPTFFDDEGLEFTPTKCTCECALCEVVFEFVVEALSRLDEILCAVALSSIMSIVEVGVNLVPGGQVAAGTRAVVEGAKSFAENGMDGKSLFTGWIGPACGVPEWDFDISMVFGKLVDAPDSMGESVGCKKKKKSECKKLDPKPDPPKSTRGPDRTSKPPSTDRATTTKPTSTTRASTITKKSTTTTKRPTTTTTRTSHGPLATDCGPCKSANVKRAAEKERWAFMYNRAPAACALPEPDEYIPEDPCSSTDGDALTTREEDDDDLASLVSRSVKSVDIDLGPSMKTTLLFGGFLSCGRAKKVAEIDKFFGFKNDNCMNAEIEQLSTQKPAGRGKVQFDTEHVYEAQTLRDFFVWLSKGTDVPGKTHKRPKPEWVYHVLLDVNSANVFRMISPMLGTVAANGDPVWTVVAYGMGRTDGIGRAKAVAQKELTILESTANGKKKNFLALETINDLGGKKKPAVADARNLIRKAAGAFSYINWSPNGGTTEATWNKFMRTSNWIDLVLYEFDRTYRWGADPARVALGEPKRIGANANLPPSLRSLYAYWIDDHLKEVEKKAAKWHDEIKKNYNGHAAYKKEPDHAKYMEAAFQAGGVPGKKAGFASKDKLKFPRMFGPGVVGSEFGVWGNADMTFDAAGGAVTYVSVGQPPAA